MLHWRDRLDDFEVAVDPIFREISVRDPSNPWERKPALSWWPTKDFEVLRGNIHRHFERFPGSKGPVHPDTTNVLKGELETLEHLWCVRDDPNKVAAVLVSASLFSRLESSRKHKPDTWPHFLSLEKLQGWAYSCWRAPGARRSWHYASTSALPFQSHDYVYKIDTMEALVRYLAEEHAALLLKYRPVVINYVSDTKPALRAI